MGRGHPLTAPCHPQTLAGRPSTAGCSSVTSAAACTAAWADTSPSSSTCATAPGPPPCSRWVLGTLECGDMHAGTTRAHWALPVPCRWCTPWQAMGPTPSGSTRCWIQRRCRAGAERQTPRTKCSKCPLCCGEGVSTGWEPPPQPKTRCPPPAPPSQSSSVPSTRCWPSSTSCPAGMMTASLPRTSARWGGGSGTPLWQWGQIPPLPALFSAAIALKRADGQPGDLPAPALAGCPGQLLPPGELWWGLGTPRGGVGPSGVLEPHATCRLQG